MDLFSCYQGLLKEYGDSVGYWPQWCADKKSAAEREKIVIGMILVQRTNWHNADIALRNLKEAGLLSVTKIANLGNLDELTRLIRPAGFYQSKPRRLFDVCRYIDNHGGIEKLLAGNSTRLRKELLAIKGIGQETADTIMLYALDKPVFVIDEYTRRWVAKNSLSNERDYQKLQNFFESNLKKDLAICRNFHTLIIVSQRGRERSRMDLV